MACQPRPLFLGIMLRFYMVVQVSRWGEKESFWDEAWCCFVCCQFFYLILHFSTAGRFHPSKNPLSGPPRVPFLVPGSQPRFTGQEVLRYMRMVMMVVSRMVMVHGEKGGKLCYFILCSAMPCHMPFSHDLHPVSSEHFSLFLVSHLFVSLFIYVYLLCIIYVFIMLLLLHAQWHVVVAW